jgi:predicted nucleotidyltransferase
LDTTLGKSPSGLQQELEAIARRYKIDDLYVFGSRAKEAAGRLRGQAATVENTQSDLDIGVKPAAGHLASPKDRVQLMIELEDLFDVNRVDLVILPEADPFLAVNVIRGELLYCADRHAQAEYELYLLRRAGDLAGYAHARMDHILAGARR